MKGLLSLGEKPTSLRISGFFREVCVRGHGSFFGQELEFDQASARRFSPVRIEIKPVDPFKFQDTSLDLTAKPSAADDNKLDDQRLVRRAVDTRHWNRGKLNLQAREARNQPEGQTAELKARLEK